MRALNSNKLRFFLLLARASRPPALEACGCAGTLPHIFPSVTVSLRQKMLGAAVCVCVLRWFFLSAGSEEIEERISVVWLRLNAFLPPPPDGSIVCFGRE